MKQDDSKLLSRGISRDMSPEAIARRLEIVSELSELSHTLGKDQNLGKVQPTMENRAEKASKRE